jgi:hypothetical protein
MLKGLFLVGVALSVLGAIMIPTPGPGFPVLAIGLVVAAAAGITLRQKAR